MSVELVSPKGLKVASNRTVHNLEQPALEVNTLEFGIVSRVYPRIFNQIHHGQ